MHDGKVATGGFQSAFVRAKGRDGRSVNCYRCQALTLKWEHLWTYCLGVPEPENRLPFRFLWPRHGGDLPLRDRFLEEFQSLHFSLTFEGRPFVSLLCANDVCSLSALQRWEQPCKRLSSSNDADNDEDDIDGHDDDEE